MSDVGVYAGLYDQIDSLARLLDDVLIALKSGDSRPHDVARHQLSDLLIQMSCDAGVDLSKKRLSIVLCEGKVSDRTAWAQMGRALQESSVDSTLTARLEALADVVENRRTRTLASMRGRLR